jgi:hypothetical protein
MQWYNALLMQKYCRICNAWIWFRIKYFGPFSNHVIGFGNSVAEIRCCFSVTYTSLSCWIKIVRVHWNSFERIIALIWKFLYIRFGYVNILSVPPTFLKGFWPKFHRCLSSSVLLHIVGVLLFKHFFLNNCF